MEKTLPSKKSSFQKIFGFGFLNLRLHDKKVREEPALPYATLRVAREKFAPNETGFIRVALYDQVRTYFKQNATK